ncbi:MAG TPA: 16S rRNA (cytosine(1402)-N(4))-methyltransferase RsmH [Solimonas sp.]|nr:16S rRNA (cytosine(1402)-N(4))-methyltransferase RsmH [Solimonas sp.]
MNLHRPVMLDEALTGLGVRAGGIYLDCTFGRGGHSGAILEVLAGSGALHALDQDPEAVAHARQVFGDRSNFQIHHANFSQLAAVADSAGIAGRIDGILMDLGVSSPQLDDAQRGFSFSRDGPLDMRMNPLAGESAAEWLARAKEADIADVLYQYGEERNSRRIARRIVETRVEQPLVSTAQLASLVAAVPGPRSRHIHPATRSFQAIRIYLNRELDVLPMALEQAVAVLAPGGRLAVISFHSLEDRIVKRYMRDAQADAATGQTKLRKIGREFPTDAESRDNPRARSAVLRVVEKVS